MGTGKRRPHLGLLTSCLPMLTSRSGPPSSADSPRKPARVPVPSSSTASYPSPPSSAVPSMTTTTARTSEDSKSSSRFESVTASSPLSPVEQSAPFFEDAPAPSTPPKKLQKAPAMPSWSPPPPPPPQPQPRPQAEVAELGTVYRLPAVTATQATPPNRGRADRSPSPDRPGSRAKLQPHRLPPQHPSPAQNPRGRSVSAQPPAVRGVSADSPRAVSSPIRGQPPPPPIPSEGSPPAVAEKKKRKSWFPGARSRANSDTAKARAQSAWLMSPDHQGEYNTAPLVNGEKVPELWSESGNVYVYVHPKGSGRGPCFKVADHIFSPSAVLVELLVTEMMATASVSDDRLDVAPPAGPVAEGHLYLPLGNTDLERLVAARNLFAFLTHQPLVATAESPTLFAALLQVAGLLRRFNFSSFDGSSFGESVDATFDVLMHSTGLADVRHSREKTLEALILAEQMKSWNLYNEAFAHAVGKYESLLDLKSPLFDRISASTRQRLERAHLGLVNRQASVNTRLEAFEFPSLFAGTASSTSSEEYRNVKFREWRSSFARMRSFVLSYYKGLFGNWPPRARSKKNSFSQSGLNRQCLKILYSDFCGLYDLLVDRQSLTPRVIDEGHEEEQADQDGARANKDKKKLSDVAAAISALRKVLSEFDKSSPPVLPPIPYDVPKLPSMTAIYENYHELPAKKQAKYSKALQPHELQLVLLKARNIDTDALDMPFLAAYKDFELREARSAHPSEFPDQRIGHWLFLYVVLQSLPMLVIDAPGLRYTDGVEDFLCEAPQGNPPWTEDAGATRKMWFQTNNSNVVELSADVVMFSVEGVYMRSHCWLAAKEWQATGGTAPAPQLPPDAQPSPLQPPRPVFRDMDPFSSGPAPGTAADSVHDDNNPNAPHRRSQSPTGGIGGPSTIILRPGSRSPPSLPASKPPSPHLRAEPLPAAAGGPNATAPSPHLRPRSDSTTDRARQAFRASIAIGLEPLPSMPAAALDRTSRVLSVGSLSSGGTGTGPGTGTASPVGEYPPPHHHHYHYQQQQQQQQQYHHPLFAGAGPGAGPGGLRASRSAVNLSPAGMGAGGQDYLGQPHGYAHMRKSSYGGLSPLSVATGVAGGGAGSGAGAVGGGGGGGGGGANDSPVGGSTFDDILKGMDGKEKKKRKLFF